MDKVYSQETSDVCRHFELHILFLRIAVFAVAIGIAVGFYTLFPNVSKTSPESNYSDVVLTGNDIYGKPLEYWAQAYWSWEVALPPGDIPLDPDTKLSKCLMGSDPDGIMIILKGSYELTYETICSISSQKPILVPLLVGV